MSEISAWTMLIPIGILALFFALFALVIRVEFRHRNVSSHRILPTAMAVFIVLIFYPMTIAPTGATANGGIVGLLSLVIASGFSWWAFIKNQKSKWVRRLVQLPVTSLVTFMAFHDAYCKAVSGWWRGF